MPVISRFRGIVIKMYFQQAEHNPPHVHVQYEGYTAAVSIHTGQIISGTIPAKVLEMVIKWIEANENKLFKMWETQEFTALPPLK